VVVGAGWVERARHDPKHTAILSDFDGTLAEIRVDPGAVRPLEGVAELLAGLGHDYATVAIVSGRPAGFLRGLLPSGIEVSGLYGLEAVRDGEQVDHPDAEPWRPVVAEAVERARIDGPRGMGIEPKGLSVTLHYRSKPALEADVLRWADAEAERSGLEARRAKRSVELHPPIAADKGTAVLRLAAGADRVCYLGDDLGDLPAFEALRQLATRGADVLGLAVGSAELDPAVRAAADGEVDGPAGARDFLASLLL
jgi:trehalose 6-phosphate phosphatase